MSRPWANFPDPDAFGVPLVAEQSSFTRSSVVTSSRACPRAPATRFTHQRATQLERRGGSSTSLDTSRFIGVSSVIQAVESSPRFNAVQSGRHELPLGAPRFAGESPSALESLKMIRSPMPNGLVRSRRPAR